MANLAEDIKALSPEKRELLELLLKKKGIQDVSTVPIIPANAESHAFPLSYGQQRLWFLEHLTPGTATYTVPVALRLRGPLREAVLADSLQAMVQRHAVLRTGVATVAGQPQPYLVPHLRLPLVVVDLRGLPAVARTGALQGQLRVAVQWPFVLSQAPLLRVWLFQLGAGEALLLLTLHHIICDAWSAAIFSRELAALYAAGCQGQAAVLPALPVQYSDYARWQRTWLGGAGGAAQLAYWRQQLAGAPALCTVPGDHPRPAVQSGRGARQGVALGREVSGGLKGLSQRVGVTLFMTLLGAWQTLVHWYTGATDVVVGTDVATRPRVEVEGLIGFFVDQVAVRTDLRGNPAFGEVLRRVRVGALGAYAHQAVPFEQVVEAVQPPRSLAYAPLFQMKLVLQNVPRSHLELAGLVVEPLEVDRQMAQLDLILNMWDTEQGLRGVVEYSTDLFEAATITNILRHFDILVRYILAQPDARLNDLSAMLTAADRQQRVITQQERKERQQQKLTKGKRQAISVQMALD